MISDNSMAKRRSKPKLKVNSGSTKRATNQANKAGSPKFKSIGASEAGMVGF